MFGVDGATACVDYNADVAGGFLGHLLALAKRVVTAAPAKALAQSKQAGCGKSKLRNPSHNADRAKDLERTPHLPEKSHVFQRKHTYYRAAVKQLCPITASAPTKGSQTLGIMATARYSVPINRLIGLARISAPGDLNLLALFA